MWTEGQVVGPPTLEEAVPSVAGRLVAGYTSYTGYNVH
jgi:hypothetical protein